MGGRHLDQAQKPPHPLGLEAQDEKTPELDEATQERLGRVLARYADELVRQPIPDEFLSLLAKLEVKERS